MPLLDSMLEKVTPIQLFHAFSFISNTRLKFGHRERQISDNIVIQTQQLVQNDSTHPK